MATPRATVPGVRVGEHLPRLAKLADRYALIPSMTHGDGGIPIAMTGHARPAMSTPYFGSVVAKLCPVGTCRPTPGSRTLPGTCSRAT